MENGKQPILDNQFEDNKGLTKREYFAGLAMQGLISSGVTEKHYLTDIVSASIQYADEILKQLEDGK